MPQPDQAGLAGTPGREAAWALGLLLLWLLLTVAVRPLLMPDEGRYATVAREMLAGSVWVPTLNGLPFFHKPPLFYWIDMAAMQLFGANAVTARAGAVAGAWLMGASLYLGARHFHGRKAAVRALLVLTTCPLFFISAQYANHDMLVAGLIGAAVLAFARALEQTAQLALRWLVLAWVLCGLGMLAKGLIGFVLPALVIGPWLLVRRQWAQIVRCFHPVAVLAGVLVAAPWFLAMQWHFAGFFDYFFMEQHVRRFAQSNFNNVQPFWFFLLLLPALTLPWSLWLPRAWAVLRQCARPEVALWAWWVIAIVGFFSLPASKLVGYVLPALAPWALLLALGLEGRRPHLLTWWAGLSAATCLAGVVGLALASPTGNRDVARQLAQGMAAGDRVVMVDAPFHDIAFLAGLHAPVQIASDWRGPKALAQDNWRKELADAARFDPARGQSVLVPLDTLSATLCGPGRTWLVVPTAQLAAVRALVGVDQVYAQGPTSLWRAAARQCM